VSDWRPSFLAATIVLFGGGFVGAVTADRSEKKATTASQGVPSPRAGQGTEESDGKGPSTQSTSPGPETTPSGIEISPPADTRAADTLTELVEGGQVEETGLADFGTHTIADKTYEGVSMYVDRTDVFGTPKLPIKTKGRYKGLRGVVGISADTDCPRNEASVSITDDQGQNLWGPYDVGFNSPKRFDIPIKGLTRVNLVQISRAPSGDSCDGSDNADPAWGQVEFVK
jgi:hypothetical protein